MFSLIGLISFISVMLPTLLVGCLLFLLSALVREIGKQPSIQRKVKTQARKLKASTVANPYPNVRTETQTKFIAMCGGDMGLVSRLAGSTQSSWEKAIYDLERDRR